MRPIGLAHRYTAPQRGAEEAPSRKHDLLDLTPDVAKQAWPAERSLQLKRDEVLREHTASSADEIEVGRVLLVRRDEKGVGILGEIRGGKTKLGCAVAEKPAGIAEAVLDAVEVFLEGFGRPTENGRGKVPSAHVCP